MPIWLSLSGIGITLGITVVQDVRRRKVSGAVVLTSLVLALCVARITGRDAFMVALGGLAAAAVVCLLFLPVIRRHWLGTGDALLFLAIGAWCGWSVFLWAAIFGSVALLPVALIARRRHTQMLPFVPALAVGLAAAQLANLM